MTFPLFIDLFCIFIRTIGGGASAIRCGSPGPVAGGPTSDISGILYDINSYIHIYINMYINMQQEFPDICIYQSTVCIHYLSKSNWG